MRVDIKCNGIQQQICIDTCTKMKTKYALTSYNGAVKQLADQEHQNNHQQQMRNKHDKLKMTTSLKKIKRIFQDNQQPEKRKR